MQHLNDAQLLERVQKGQEDAFTVLYKRYRPIMLAIAKKKLINHQEAEDAVQEIFTSFWQRRKEIPSKIPIKNYLLRAVHFQYAYRCRANSVARKHEIFLGSMLFNNNQLNFVENKELGQQIRTAIQKISAPACRKIFELAYIEDRNCNEIAVSLNIHKQVVRNQTSRALKVIRENLKHVV